MSNEREQSTGFESMECGHSRRYRYNKAYNPDNQCDDRYDQTEDWGCSLCDLWGGRRDAGGISMKTKHTFKKGDRVRITAATLRRWRKADRGMRYDRAGEYSGKVGEVTDVRPNPSPYPPSVRVRFKGKHTGFVPDWLEKVR